MNLIDNIRRQLRSVIEWKDPGNERPVSPVV